MQKRREALLQALGQTLQQQIWHGHRHLMSISEKTGLTVPQTIVLEKLQERNEPCSMQELSELTLQSGAALTGVIDRLVKSGFVVRVPHVHDRRVVSVILTEAGTQRLQDFQQYIRTSFARNMRSFSDEELQQFTTLLQKLMAASDEPPGTTNHPTLCDSAWSEQAGDGQAAVPGQP